MTVLSDSLNLMEKFNNLKKLIKKMEHKVIYDF